MSANSITCHETTADLCEPGCTPHLTACFYGVDFQPHWEEEKGVGYWKTKSPPGERHVCLLKHWVVVVVLLDFCF